MNNNSMKYLILSFFIISILALPCSMEAAEFADTLECAQACSDNCNLYQTGYAASECTTNCGNQFCPDPDYLTATNAAIEQYAINYVQQEGAVFPGPEECADFCGKTCASQCPNMLAQCQTACVGLVCENNAWMTASGADISEFGQKYIADNPNCESIGTTVGQGEQAAAALENPIAASSMPEIIVNIIQVLLTLLGSAALLVFIYGGIMMITSAGNEEKVKKARATLVWAVLGLAIILGSYAILSFVFGIFG